MTVIHLTATVNRKRAQVILDNLRVAVVFEQGSHLSVMDEHEAMADKLATLTPERVWSKAKFSGSPEPAVFEMVHAMLAELIRREAS